MCIAIYVADPPPANVCTAVLVTVWIRTWFVKLESSQGTEQRLTADVLALWLLLEGKSLVPGRKNGGGALTLNVARAHTYFVNTDRSGPCTQQVQCPSDVPLQHLMDVVPWYTSTYPRRTCPPDGCSYQTLIRVAHAIHLLVPPVAHFLEAPPT